jgi:hypothetical protein
MCGCARHGMRRGRCKGHYRMNCSRSWHAGPTRKIGQRREAREDGRPRDAQIACDRLSSITAYS